MNLPLFIATKLYKDNGDEREVSRPAIRIAIAGVAIGLAVMIVSVCVVLGFKHTIRDKVIGFGSHINVGALLSIQANEPYPIQMNDSMLAVLSGIEGVKHVQRYAYKQGILKTDSDFLGVMFKGVAEEYDTAFIHQNMVDGSIPSFSSQASKQQIVVSKMIADKLSLKVGDRVFAYFISDVGVRPRKYTIAGIYQTNLSMYDRAICLTDLYSTVKLNGWHDDQVSGAEMTADHFDELEQVEERVIKDVNKTRDSYGETYSSLTIQEMNPQIFSWLELLDVNVWIILALMAIVALGACSNEEKDLSYRGLSVAAFTMISGLLIIILERTNMIGVLKALGSKNRTVRHAFLWFAAFVVGRGLIWGNIVGLALVILQKTFGIVKLDPATYYVSTVPVELNLYALILLNAATLAVSIFVLIAPSHLVSHIQPARSIRYE